MKLFCKFELLFVLLTKEPDNVLDIEGIEDLGEDWITGILFIETGTVTIFDNEDELLFILILEFEPLFVFPATGIISLIDFILIGLLFVLLFKFMLLLLLVWILLFNTDEFKFKLILLIDNSKLLF